MFVFSVVSNIISLLVGSFLVTGRFRSTEQLALDFRFTVTVMEAAVGGVRARVKEWNTAAGNRTEREGG